MRCLSLVRVVVLCGIVLPALETAAPAGEPITTSDLLKIRSVASIDVSRDGTRAVVAVRSVGVIPPADDAPDDAEPTWDNRVHLLLLDLTDPEAPPRQLTFGERRDSVPTLSPDGTRLAFTRAGTDPQAKAQAWVMALGGGEARPVTAFEEGVTAVRWSPDGRRLLVTSKVPLGELEGAPSWPMERPRRSWKDAAAGEDVTPRPDGTRAEVRAWLARNAAAQDPLVINRLAFQDEQKLHEELELAHLFLVDVDTVGAEPRRLTRDFCDHLDAEFSPDGRSVLYAAKKTDDVHPDRVLETAIWQVDVATGAERAVLAQEGWSLRQPRPSLDGTVIALLGRQTDEPAFRPVRLGLASVNGGGGSVPIWLTGDETLDAPVRAFRWMPLRTSVIFTAARQGGTSLLSISPGLLEPAVLVEQEENLPVGVHAFGVGGGAIVYAITTWQNPAVVRVRDARGDRVVLDLNPWTATRDRSRPREGWITRPDGQLVQYWLMPPTRLEPDRQYPLALQIHGGPSGMWGPGELTMWHEFQLLCNWGYGVVYANPRGSTGYGYAFQKANFRDWGAGPGGDVLAVVDQALLEEWVDPERLVVTGGSYAGYLTAWLVAHDHRFKAAVAQRGVYDLQTFFGEGNAWRLVQWAFGGWPWDPRTRPVLQRESPFTYVSRIRTPLLIMHGSSDLRTGVSQSEMMYRALKELGRPVEYVRYPRAGHDLSRTGEPRQRMDRINRIIEFFERSIENARPAPVPASEGTPEPAVTPVPAAASSS